MTEAEKENLRTKARERIAQNEKEKGTRGDNSNPNKKVIGNPTNLSGGDNPNPINNPIPIPNPSPVNPVGDNVVPIQPPKRIGSQIPKIQKETVVTVDSEKFYSGLPAFVRLTFKALNNLLGIFNWLPFPFKLELEEMDKDEANLFSEAIKPGLEAGLPGMGKKHPFILLGWSLVIGFIGKLKASWKPKKEKVIDNGKRKDSSDNTGQESNQSTL